MAKTLPELVGAAPDGASVEQWAVPEAPKKAAAAALPARPYA